MKAWTCNEFEGHWPVGVAAVIMADTVELACKLLEDELSKGGLTQEIKPNQLVPLPMQHRYVRILCDGN